MNATDPTGLREVAPNARQLQMLQDTIGFMRGLGRHVDAADWAAGRMADKRPRYALKHETRSDEVAGEYMFGAMTDTWPGRGESKLTLGLNWSKNSVDIYCGLAKRRMGRDLFETRLEMASLLAHEHAHSQGGDEYGAYASEVNYLTGLFAHLKAQGGDAWKLDAIHRVYDTRLMNADPNGGAAKQLPVEQWNKLTRPGPRFWKH